jgi:uncharacterized protein (DUF952 family)
MALICHITRRTDWENAVAGGGYSADSLGSQGFIHCSTPPQVVRVANSLFRGQADLVLLCVDEKLVQPEIRYENLRGGAELFPHIYGVLNPDAVVRVIEFPPDRDGRFELPREVRELAGALAES